MTIKINTQRERAIEEMAQTPIEDLLEILKQVGLCDKDFVLRVWSSVCEREGGNLVPFILSDTE